MRPSAVGCLASALLGAGCFYTGVQPANSVAVSARVRLVASEPQWTTIPDIPEVPGVRIDARIVHATLDRYGTWIDDAVYGTVWVPALGSVGAEFVPYGTHGHWVLTDAGWYWHSELPWGWLTFHYGRWVLIDGTWAWVPGALFAPAWVAWRVGQGWVGWAALPPRGAAFTAPFVFCRMEELASPGIWSRVIHGPAGAWIYSSTVPVLPSSGVGGAVYSWGPSRMAVRQGVAVVPIAAAWRADTAPRSGVPVGERGEEHAGAQPAGSTGSSVSGRSNWPEDHRFRRFVDRPVPLPRNDTVPNFASDFLQSELRSERTSVSGRSASDTVVLRSQAREVTAFTSPRTISLGTTDPVISSSHLTSNAPNVSGVATVGSLLSSSSLAHPVTSSVLPSLAVGSPPYISRVPSVRSVPVSGIVPVERWNPPVPVDASVTTVPGPASLSVTSFPAPSRRPSLEVMSNVPPLVSPTVSAVTSNASVSVPLAASGVSLQTSFPMTSVAPAVPVGSALSVVPRGN